MNKLEHTIHRSFFLELPEEIKREVYSFLPDKAINAVLICCKNLALTVNHENTWKYRVIKKLGDRIGQIFFEEFHGWKMAYIHLNKMKKEGKSHLRIGKCDEQGIKGEGKRINLKYLILEEGTFNGTLNGPGKITWPNGRREEGEFKNGSLHGRGTRIHADQYNKIEKGFFENGKLNGVGSITSLGQNKIGTFKDGFLKGEGTVIQSNGIQFIGKFIKKEGTLFSGTFKGYVILDDGTKYDDEFDYSFDILIARPKYSSVNIPKPFNLDFE